ncbi:MFS transporter [Sphingomonas sp. LB2R24]|uniref:MFS transporter n=1 Tax=Sphingomonas sorbitolis TaxID=3096165 RepID=UPI002FCA0958
MHDVPIEAASKSDGGAGSARVAHLGRRVSALYGGLYLHYGFYAFLPVWLNATGSTSTEIGVLMAIPLILRLATVAPFAAWCGRRGRVRDGIAVTAIVAAILVTTLLIAPGHIGRVVSVVAFAIVWDQIPVLVDAYAVMAVRSHALDFGRMRVWGSIAVVASNAAAGWALGVAGIRILPVLIAVLLLIPVLIVPILPRDRLLMRELPGRNSGWRELFADRQLMASLVAASMVMGSHGLINSFGAIQWTASGIPPRTIGLLNALAVASEIIAFVFGARVLSGRDPRMMIAVASFAAALRWAIMATGPGIIALCGAQLLQGLSATGAILAPMLIIAARVPNRLSSSAQGLNAVLLGALLALVTALSGMIWQLGELVAYGAMLTLALMAMPLLAVTNALATAK